MSLVGYFEIVAYDDKLVSANMSTGQQKAFCVLRFSKCQSVIAVQRDFHRRYRIDAPKHTSMAQVVFRYRVIVQRKNHRPTTVWNKQLFGGF